MFTALKSFLFIWEKNLSYVSKKTLTHFEELALTSILYYANPKQNTGKVWKSQNLHNFRMSWNTVNMQVYMLCYWLQVQKSFLTTLMLFPLHLDQYVDRGRADTASPKTLTLL